MRSQSTRPAISGALLMEISFPNRPHSRVYVHVALQTVPGITITIIVIICRHQTGITGWRRTHMHTQTRRHIFDESSRATRKRALHLIANRTRHTQTHTDTDAHTHTHDMHAAQVPTDSRARPINIILSGGGCTRMLCAVRSSQVCIRSF